MRKITETIEEYNEKGDLIRKTTTETTEDGDAEKIYVPNPIYPWTPTNPYWPQITCTTSSNSKTE